jgi:hypothetical protein
MVETLQLSNTAVCTSGDYERHGHIVDARSRRGPGQIRAPSQTPTSAQPRAQQPTPTQTPAQAQTTQARDEQTPSDAQTRALTQAQEKAPRSAETPPPPIWRHTPAPMFANAPADAPQQPHAHNELASVTVIAPTAMAADGLSTAAMVLGRQQGAHFLEQQGVRGVLVAPDGSVWRVNL